MDRIKKLFIYLFAKMKCLFLLPIAKLKFAKKPVWLVCERGTDARDSGYHMFRYLRKEHPEIEAWYVITRDSDDLKRIADLGNIALNGSLNHWLSYIRAKMILTAHQPCFCPSSSHKFYEDMIKKNRQKIVFLQHGIIGGDLPLYYQERFKFDLFICGAKPEFDYVSSHFHYTHNEVRYTGLARFDALHGFTVKRQILIMPTYRKWLWKLGEQEVAQSEYVKWWNHLLGNPMLAEIAEKYHVKIIFYPHQMMQKFIKLFSYPPSKKILIADCHHYDVQPLLKESGLLVTDYSSVHFDFAYMKKPVLYYQFDEEDFFTKHIGRGYFNYETMGFGEKVQTEEQLIRCIDEYALMEFRLKPEYEQRIEGFFPLNDTHNCDRIYQEILKTFGSEL